MARSDVFETVDNLVDMKRSLSAIALAELRTNNPDARTRIERLVATWPNGVTKNGHEVVSFAGNSGIYIPGKHGSTVSQAYNISAHYLRPKNQSLPSVVIYPFGIVDLTSHNRPVFEDPARSTMKSIALEFKPEGYSASWLQQPVEPLFNVTGEGNVLARFHDQPTPTELQFVNDLLEELESAPHFSIWRAKS